MSKYLILAAVLVGCLLLTCLPAVEAQKPFTPNVAAEKPKPENNWAYGIWIFSPANITYTQNTLQLNTTAKRYINPAYYDTEIKYSINKAENTTVKTTTTCIPHAPVSMIYGDIASYTLFKGTVTLPELPQGTYNLTVYAQYNRKEGADLKWPNMADVQTVQFTVNLGVPPTVTLLQFNSTPKTAGENVSVNFAVDAPINWAGYSLDGQTNITVSGNFTLTNLEAGEHNVTVYAVDPLGNMGASETKYFAVVEPEKTQVWLPVALAIVAAAVFGGSLILHRRERHHYSST